MIITNHLKVIRLTAFEKEKVFLIRSYILSHPHEPLGSPGLAFMEGISVYKLEAGFVLLYEQTVQQFIKVQRMEKAKELLLQTNEPVKAIAAHCGYKSDTSFHRAFKKYSCYTPDDFRKL